MMLVRNITDKTLFPKTFKLASDIRLAPGESVPCATLKDLPGWASIETLINSGFLAYEESPAPPIVEKPEAKKPTVKKAVAKVSEPEETKPPKPARSRGRRRKT